MYVLAEENNFCYVKLMYFQDSVMQLCRMCGGDGHVTCIQSGQTCHWEQCSLTLGYCKHFSPSVLVTFF